MLLLGAARAGLIAPAAVALSLLLVVVVTEEAAEAL
jgi:hypothetical protein